MAPDAPFEHRPTVAVDFDGVLHSYESGWAGACDIIPDGPVPGAIEWLNEAALRYDIVVMSARAEDDAACEAIAEWLAQHGFRGMVAVTNIKPNAQVYIDDRAFRFEGVFPTHEEIMRQPWNKP